MATLEWSEALALGLPCMDDTHQEFVALLADCESAGADALPAAWSAFIDHTADHFGAEDAWMQATGYASGNCHSTQHRVVLQVLREGQQALQGGDAAPVRQMIRELGSWFPFHAQSMDAALALHLRSVGFDPLHGTIAQPERLPTAALQGCGGCA